MLVIPFTQIFHIIYPINIFDKSAWIALPVLALFSLYIGKSINKKLSLKKTTLSVLSVIFLSFIIYFIRKIIYEDNSIINIRYITTSLVYIMLVICFTQNSFAMRALGYAVLLQSFLVAVIRMANFYIFPNYAIGNAELESSEQFINSNAEIGRELLFVSSISANHIVCGMFVGLILFKAKIVRWSPVKIVFFQLFMMLATFNTQSRYPIAVAIAIFCLTLLQLKITSLKNIIFLLLTSIILFVIVANFQTGFDEFINKILTVSVHEKRGDKLIATYILITNSALDFLIGSSSSLVLATEVNGTLISDNSYGLIATSFGVPFACIYFVMLFKIFYKNKSDSISIYCLLYIFIGFALTNCILWEAWVFTSFVSYGIASYYGRNSLISSTYNLGHRKA